MTNDMRWFNRRLAFFALMALAFAIALVPVAVGQVAPSPNTAVAPANQSLAIGDAPTLFAQGKRHYEIGQLAESAMAWQAAALLYRQAGDGLHQGISLNYLALAYQDLGEWEKAKAAIAQSLSLLEAEADAAHLAQALNTRGSLELATGQTEAALKTWQAAERAYARAGDTLGVLGSQINQAQAWQGLGMFRRAQKRLEQVQQELQTQPDSLVKATGLRSLGIVWQAVGDLQASQTILEESLAVARTLNSAPDISAALLSLGNTTRRLGDERGALAYYQQAGTIATSLLDRLEAQLNQLKLLIQLERLTEAQALIPVIEDNLAQLPPSRDAIYGQVNVAESLMALLERDRQSPDEGAIARRLAHALQDAKALKDARAESLALGTLGKLYDRTQQWKEAQELTQRALVLSQSIQASDISYQWQWQLAQILTQRGEIEPAIAANQQAVDILRSLRGDLVAMNPDVRFSFQEQIEPIYRHLVSLLLQSPTQAHLKQARDAIESLQLAELENFFRTPCLEAKAEQIDTLLEKGDRAATVLYPIILPDRLAVIVSLPGQPLQVYSTNLSQAEVEETISQLRQSMNPALSDKQRLRLSQTLYDWLIRPVENALVQRNIETLVFVLDGALRNVPMAALHDGERYLIEKYGVAIAPGLQLLEPRSLGQIRLQSLTGGLSQARQGFAPLPAVEVEVEQISRRIPSQVLLNEEFTQATLEKRIEDLSFAVIHLATHGQFSSNPEETFLLTWDKRLNVNTLSQLITDREQRDGIPLELLVLSACQTAYGDKRAALGLAGLAVRSGARSTVATLWSVNDRSTAELMTQFYQNLTQTNSQRAESLRQAQLSLLAQKQYEHPYYWAPFILVGNWL
jgi:CHAT domain-containing protein